MTGYVEAARAAREGIAHTMPDGPGTMHLRVTELASVVERLALAVERLEAESSLVCDRCGLASTVLPHVCYVPGGGEPVSRPHNCDGWDSCPNPAHKDSGR